MVTSISPETRRRPSEAGGSSSATASPVTSWSTSAYGAELLVRVVDGVTAERRAYRPGVGRGRRTVPRGPRRLRARAPARMAAPGPAAAAVVRARGRGRRAGRPLPGGGHPPERDPLDGARPGGGRLPEQPARPRPHAGGRDADDRLERRRGLLRRAGSRRRSTAPGGGGWPRCWRSYAVAAVMIWWLLQHPQVEQTLLDASRGRPAGQQRLRELLLRVGGLALRRAGVDQQRLGGRALHRVRGAGPAGDLRCCGRTW